MPGPSMVDEEIGIPAKQELSMLQLRHLLRLHYDGVSAREIGRARRTPWAERLDEPLLLAAEQHDIGWSTGETAPSFDPLTGRPHLFRAVGARLTPV
jgi:hypothetical protein